MKEFPDYLNDSTVRSSVNDLAMDFSTMREEVVSKDTLLDQTTTCDSITTVLQEGGSNCDVTSHAKLLPESRGLTNNVIVMLLYIIPTLLSMALLWVLATTCNSGYQCRPQFSARLTDNSVEAQKLLDCAREGLNMISNLAMDFSPALNGNTSLLSQNTSAYLDVIDTLLTDNLYLFSYDGYCRHHIPTGKRVCSQIAGLDVVLAMVKDMGNQLGTISRMENLLDMGTYFLTAYVGVLDELERLWRRRNEKTDMGRFDTDSLSSAHYLKKLRKYAQAMRILCFLLVAISMFSSTLMCCAVIVFFCFPSRSFTFFRVMTVTSIIATGVSLVVSAYVVLSETDLVGAASMVFKDLAMCHISYGSGFYVFIFHVIMSIASLLVGLYVAHDAYSFKTWSIGR